MSKLLGFDAPNAATDSTSVRVKPALLLSACLALAGCPSDPTTQPQGLPKGFGVLALEWNGDSSEIEAWDPSSHALTQQTGLYLDPQDPWLSVKTDSHGTQRIFVVSRRETEDVTEVGPTGRELARWPAAEAGVVRSGTNPHDVDVAPDGSLWITRYGVPTLLVVHPDGSTDKVDLSSYGAVAGHPFMDGIRIVSGIAYVSLLGLSFPDQHVVPGTSRIIAVDTTTRVASPFLTFDASSHLSDCSGPIGVRQRADGRTELVLTCIGGPRDTPANLDAGVARVLLPTTPGGAPTLASVLPASTTHAFPVSVQIVSESLGYAILAQFDDGANATSVVDFDPSGAHASRLIMSTTQYDYWDLQTVGSTEPLVLIADRRSSAPGIHLVSQVDDADIGFLSTQMPPIRLAVLTSN